MLEPVTPETSGIAPQDEPRVLTERLETPAGGAAAPSRLASKRLAVGKSDQPIHPPGGIGLESLIGLDERTRILDTEDAPWNMICALEIKGPWGNFVGTGWFAGPKTIVTAGHCVYEKRQMGGWAKEIIVRPGCDGAEVPFGPVKATRFESTKQWLATQAQDYDIGVIHLDAPVHDDIGWFGVSSLPDDDLLARFVNVSGYPGDKGGREQWWARNRVKGLSPLRIYYDVDTVGGQSGAPVFIVDKEGDTPKVVGIHAYGVGGAKPAHIKEEVNSAPRITPEVVELIQGWIKADGGAS